MSEELGGDEFIAVLQGLDKQAVRKLFEDLRKDIAAESKEHREIPLSYAAGFAMARMKYEEHGSRRR